MAKRSTDLQHYTVAIVKEPQTITPTLFAQLPERDFMDHETGLLINEHRLHGRVVWHGKVWLIFSCDLDPAMALYRYELREADVPAIMADSEKEAHRLTSVVEAIRVRDGRFDELPVRLRVCGRSYYLQIYTHSCWQVRYPYLKLGPDGLVGTAKKIDIQAWLESEGFVADISEPEVIGVMESVIQAAEKRLLSWQSTRQHLAQSGQVYLHPEDDELLASRVLDTIRRPKP